MHAYLLLGENEKRINEFEGKKVDFLLLKIADVRELNRFTRLKLTEKTAIVIRNFDRASEETQNAFLKALEEPQENLTYVLTAANIENVLETIVSRCEVIETNTSELIKTSESKRAKEFMDGSLADKFLAASKINKREDAIEFMKDLIFVGHKELLKNNSEISMLEMASKTLIYLEANGNVTLQLTNFVLNCDYQA